MLNGKKEGLTITYFRYYKDIIYRDIIDIIKILYIDIL